MLAYPWPGNVRELENEVERLVVLAGDSPTIGADVLSPRIRQWTPTSESGRAIDPSSLPAAVEALERRMIGAAMRRHRGNKTRAAEELKVSRRNLIRLVQKYEIE
jgi:transcriptional regulator with PAS, ATPase and Fis domain